MKLSDDYIDIFDFLRFEPTARCAPCKVHTKKQTREIPKDLFFFLRIKKKKL